MSTSGQIATLTRVTIAGIVDAGSQMIPAEAEVNMEMSALLEAENSVLPNLAQEMKPKIRCILRKTESIVADRVEAESSLAADEQASEI